MNASSDTKHSGDRPLTVQAARDSNPARCAACEALQQAPLVCEDCHTLLDHVIGADCFELFSLPRRFEINLEDLERKYLAISRNVHPDRFASSEPAMQTFALRVSAAINTAYDVLKDPHRRAEYLLETFGGKSAADDKRTPPDLLSQVMTLREDIEEARIVGNRDALRSIQSLVMSRKAATLMNIADLCDRLATRTGESGVKDELRMQLNAVKYYNNLLEHVRKE